MTVMYVCVIDDVLVEQPRDEHAKKHCGPPFVFSTITNRT